MLVHANEVLALRTATADDLDDLTDIACAAFPLDPQWDYRFPRRKEFPEDNWNCTRMQYKTLLETPGNAIKVITVPTKKEGETVHRSIALAVWELPEDAKSTMFTVGSWMKTLSLNLQPVESEQHADGCEDRRDADFKRMKAFTDTIAKAKGKWFDDEYGGNQLHLRILGTHPDYQRRGAGTKHCEWGMKLAKEYKVPITLFSSPLGQKLYSHLGFIILATVTVQVKGEEEKLSIGVMIYKGSC